MLLYHTNRLPVLSRGPLLRTGSGGCWSLIGFSTYKSFRGLNFRVWISSSEKFFQWKLFGKKCIFSEKVSLKNFTEDFNNGPLCLKSVFLWHQITAVGLQHIHLIHLKESQKFWTRSFCNKNLVAWARKPTSRERLWGMSLWDFHHVHLLGRWSTGPGLQSVLFGFSERFTKRLSESL